jgi:hypothetical protein
MDAVANNSSAMTEAGTVAEELIAAVERTPLRQHPFDHIYMEEVFGADMYKDMLAHVPDGRFFHELVHRDALRADGTSTRLRMYLYPELLGRLPAAQRRSWVPLARALCSPELEHAFKRKFRAALEQRFGKPVENIRLYPIPILLRDQPGYRIGIHADVPTKAITVQFYLPANASQRHIGTIFHEGNEGAAAERTTQMPFMPSTGYAFPVTASKSWHSAAKTAAGDGERMSMMVTYYVTETPLPWLKLRLRRLALRFGIRPKG